MIIRSLMNDKCDMVLHWLIGFYPHTNNELQVCAEFRDIRDGASYTKKLPFNVLPILVPGLIVSSGRVTTARINGKHLSQVIPDLSSCDEINAAQCRELEHFDFNQLLFNSQKILCYQIKDKTVLIPSVELIRYLFLHNRIMAESVLKPAGLLNLAVTPFPGFYDDVKIEFKDQVPRKLLTREFVQEFCWLSIDPDARKSWDSIRHRSSMENFLAFDPPPLRNCELSVRGIQINNCLLVLEIISLTGRSLPAKNIKWTHPRIIERDSDKSANNKKSPISKTSHKTRTHGQGEYTLNENIENLKISNQNVLLIGGKKSCFAHNACLEKIPRARRALASAEYSGGDERKGLCSGREVSGESNLSPTINNFSIDGYDRELYGAQSLVDFSVLEAAEYKHIGNLNFLYNVLEEVENVHQGLTVTRYLCYLKNGAPFSHRNNHRRMYLIAIFMSPGLYPRILIDVDHSRAKGLSALFLRYDWNVSISTMTSHVKEIVDALVSNYGHWDSSVEERLSKEVFIKRFPKLFRNADIYKNSECVQRWIARISIELNYHQLTLCKLWKIA